MNTQSLQTWLRACLILISAGLCASCVAHPATARTMSAEDCAPCHSDKMALAAVTHTTAERACKKCHVTTDWATIGYTHELPFALAGAHVELACRVCHGAGFHTDTATCWTCHAADYEGAQNPLHAGFPQDCAICHSQVAWEGAEFIHKNFSLGGAHIALVDRGACTSCHINNYTDVIDGSCINCHRPEYNSTSAPDHTAIGLSTSCTSCHSQDAWSPADTSFHDSYYRITGDHTRLSCQDCHTGTSPSSYTCTDCHAHSRTEMDDEHDDVSSYSYQSSRCFACHKNGGGDD